MLRPFARTADRARTRTRAEQLGSPIPARLELISGARAVWIVALDRYGAQVRIDAPPPVGGSALLKWEAHEHFATVSSIGAGECSLTFDRQVPHIAPPSVGALTANQPRPVAALDQMRTRKRRKALVLDHTRSDAAWEWVVRLRRHAGPIGPGDTLTPEEQMFFFASPLAHVLERQRAAGVRAIR